jgi:hypothetical protein
MNRRKPLGKEQMIKVLAHKTLPPYPDACSVVGR